MSSKLQIFSRTKGHKNFRKIQRKVHDAVTNTTKLTTFYIYTDIVPKGYLVQSFEPPNSKDLVWTRLWQDFAFYSTSEVMLLRFTYPSK